MQGFRSSSLNELSSDTTPTVLPRIVTVYSLLEVAASVMSSSFAMAKLGDVGSLVTVIAAMPSGGSTSTVYTISHQDGSAVKGANWIVFVVSEIVYI